MKDLSKKLLKKTNRIKTTKKSVKQSISDDKNSPIRIKKVSAIKIKS